MFHRLHISLYIAVIGVFFHITSGMSQDEDYVFYKNFVKHADGSSCEHSPPEATFTAFLNSDSSRILIESAPRWVYGVDPNIDGKGTFGVELGNFHDPSLVTGDSVFIRFTCKASGQRDVLSEEIYDIPFHYFPQTLTLSELDLPETPGNVRVRYNEQHQRLVQWDAQSGLTFDVYRTNLLDTIPRGLSMRQYQLMARDISQTSWLDTNTTTSAVYSYIVYARSSQGVYSSHSREAIEGPLISNFTVSPGVTTARLHLGNYDPKLGNLQGFNIYRRKPGNTWQIVGYSGRDSIYIDSRLQPGEIYEYMIAARTGPRTEFGESAIVEMQTTADTSGLYHYANLKVAVVVYQNTNNGAITSTYINRIKRMMNLGRLFYWRNSGMKLNVQFYYYLIEEYKDFGNPDDLNVGMTVADLNARGVMNTQYDIIFRITPATYGYWSIGVQPLNLDGPDRKTGFSQSFWPIGSGVQYPGAADDINYGLTWIFVHECQHAIDALYDDNLHSEMYHGDIPWQFPRSCGEHYDFQATMFRDFNAYTDLQPEWGDIYETRDIDEDGFPDAESMVPRDEQRYGSNPGKADSDADGLSDRQEFIDGTFQGSHPEVQDTDNDGILDGQDQYPRYPLQTEIKSFSPVIDGIIEEEWPLIHTGTVFSYVDFQPQLFMSYDDDWLYLALRYEKYAEPRISLDFHADGWWHSSGNTVMRINPQNGNFTEFRSWDASSEVQQFSMNNGGPGGMWDNESAYQQEFNRRVIAPGTVKQNTQYEAPVTTVEIAIPRNKYAGLTLQKGDRLGLNVNYYNLEEKNSQWACTFDKYSFANVTLGQATALTDEDDLAMVKTFALHANYPNPFNQQTIIRYDIPRREKIEICIYNALGQRVRTLVNAQQSKGQYQLWWDGRNGQGRVMPSGIYFYSMKVGGSLHKVQKMLLVK
ncbi:MAG: T9SS type A sorting domain-containing protein [Caldithrix sp.]|nr:T9SS type A sorting domain-containing protein [Caldithrix sp.]